MVPFHPFEWAKWKTAIRFFICREKTSQEARVANKNATVSHSGSALLLQMYIHNNIIKNVAPSESNSVLQS